MTGLQKTLINFVSRGLASDPWRLVLIEAGPWQPPFEGHLRRLQERLFGCVNAALDGQLVDCYDLPEMEVRTLFDAFAAGIFGTPHYRDALAQTPFVSGISFELSFDHIH